MRKLWSNGTIQAMLVFAIIIVIGLLFCSCSSCQSPSSQQFNYYMEKMAMIESLSEQNMSSSKWADFAACIEHHPSDGVCDSCYIEIFGFSIEQMLEEIPIHYQNFYYRRTYGIK